MSGAQELGVVLLGLALVGFVVWLWDWQRARTRKRENRRKVLQLMAEMDQQIQQLDRERLHDSGRWPYPKAGGRS